MNAYLSLGYAMIMLWIGIQRCIDAQAFKPNAFWFCVAVGGLSIVAGYLFRLRHVTIARLVGSVASLMALSFYVYCLIVQPEKDANVRVGMAIVASAGYLSLILLPASDRESPEH